MSERRLGFRGTEQNTLGVDDAKPFLSHGRSAIMESVSGFSSVSRRETWRVPVPRIRDRLHRTEHCALRTAAQGVRPEGSSIALSRRPPRRDIFAAATAHSASAPRTPSYRIRGRLWSRCAPVSSTGQALRTGRALTSSRLLRRSFALGCFFSHSGVPHSARGRLRRWNCDTGSRSQGHRSLST